MIKTVFPINFLARFFITVYNMASWYSVQKIRKNYAKMQCPQETISRTVAILHVFVYKLSYKIQRNHRNASNFLQEIAGALIFCDPS